MLFVFLLWTTAIRFMDVQTIGPQNSSVGFATVNRFVHHLTGVHMSLYQITDWLGLVPLLFAAGFSMLGFVQWIQRKDFMKVDYDLLVLGGFYIVVIAVYILFEVFVVNYRPVLINGVLEGSYPSSTTMLVMCVMPTAMMQFRVRIHNKIAKRLILSFMAAFVLFMVIGRLLSGVHWFTDIVGGALLSAGLVGMYRAVIHWRVL
ncbi:MAG: phosphatase PAP2 family protein [Ruminococcaceae bacterium]|nr:phosphatase PAP2 family protein [Oscillospiraceae bacterium]